MYDVATISVQDVPDPLPAGTTMLDVREPVEWEHGHIRGALHIPLRELPERTAELPEGRLLVVCKVGGRSAQATAFLAHLGRDAVNVDGGMVEWAEAGRAIVAEGDLQPVVV